jgi:Zn-dependent M28 family amino/carboxypeptidase
MDQAVSPQTATPNLYSGVFDGYRALRLVEEQVAFGPRYYGADGHLAVQAWIAADLRSKDWSVTFQNDEIDGLPVTNILAERGTGKEDHWVLIGTHYDTRPISDSEQDESLSRTPVPGANDGASGVAVLLELARVLPKKENVQVTLAFFDAEDSGGIANFDWGMGSSAFVASNSENLPDQVIIVDMVGDADQQIYLEKNSNPFLAGEIWALAADLGVGTFYFEEKFAMIDDHTPFVSAGVPTALIIDFDYPAWHTTGDTMDKISAESLENVGKVLVKWLIQTDVNLQDD